MSARFDVDREVTSWLVSERPTGAPDGLLEAVAAGVATTPRRRGWQIADRWTWRHEARLRAASRVAVVAAVLASLTLASSGPSYSSGRLGRLRRSASPGPG